MKQNVKVIFCIGETLEEREGDKTNEVVSRQVEALAKVIEENDWKDIVIAYEPVWAIGVSHLRLLRSIQRMHTDLSQTFVYVRTDRKGEQDRIEGGSTPFLYHTQPLISTLLAPVLEQVATPEQAQDTHKVIREFLAKRVSQKVADETRIIYGGSVAAKNAKELCLCPDIDGALVGGASLKPEFADIITSAEEAYKTKARL